MVSRASLRGIPEELHRNYVATVTRQKKYEQKDSLPSRNGANFSDRKGFDPEYTSNAKREET